MENITQERLKSLLHYEPETGVFTHLTKTKNKQIGDEAGSIPKHGYRQICVDGKLYYAHRLAFLYMTGAFPTQFVDHINHKPADNRWCNLRPASQVENHYNRSLSSNNKSGIKGVIWNVHQQKWLAYITANYVRYHLGSFSTKEEAAEAVAAKRIELHGAFGYQATKEQ
jgi:hypothetical protein